ncbi:SCP2 sterol-binding domain-containing protein [Hirschia baltica]|uniref:Sterol-binding domain protein n=1 Tax=Hirschia baltica (strain ATCC 49814 / DSM 5838 / IFAM 1418) TaxID=582402 RepID=C6XRP9_HIRBI|nr:SCP2 sterol-binding domain-containing protein [Hirschia baltica]ACT60659.1 Sterol-binding domain protein [Hirschia baltica ATCC 49814]
MDLNEITAKIAGVVSSGTDFDNTVKFDFGDIGKLFIDGAQNAVTNEDGEADATISVDFEDFKKLAQGQMDPMMAFMQGKLKVAGDMSVAMKLQGLFSSMS